MQNSPLLSNICDILYNVLIVGLAFRGNLVYLFLQSWWLNCSWHSLACSRLHLHAADTNLCNITIGRWKESNSFYLVIGSLVFVSVCQPRTGALHHKLWVPLQAEVSVMTTTIPIHTKPHLCWGPGNCVWVFFVLSQH